MQYTTSDRHLVNVMKCDSVCLVLVLSYALGCSAAFQRVFPSLDDGDSGPTPPPDTARNQARVNGPILRSGRVLQQATLGAAITPLRPPSTRVIQNPAAASSTPLDIIHPLQQLLYPIGTAQLVTRRIDPGTSRTSVFQLAPGTWHLVARWRNELGDPIQVPDFVMLVIEHLDFNYWRRGVSLVFPQTTSMEDTLVAQVGDPGNYIGRLMFLDSRGMLMEQFMPWLSVSFALNRVQH